MSCMDVVENLFNNKIKEYEEAREKADNFDKAILSVMIAVIVDLKKELGLD